MTLHPLPFTRSTLCIALIGITCFSHAEQSTTVLPVIEVQTASSQQSSEQSKAYIVQESNSAAKLNIEAKETPQTINVVTRQQMDDFALNSTRDILNNTPGVIVNELETERAVYLARGFEISNVLVDGIGFPSGEWNYNDTNPDSYFYDRVEVIKGADALTNAFGDPSATINQIRKRPTRDFQANAGLSYGSWDMNRYQADVSGSVLDGRIRGRVMGYEQTENSYLDKYSVEKNGLGTILEADITDSTLATVGYNTTKNKPNANNWGALPLLDNHGQQITYDRSFNPNPEWAYWDNHSQNAFFSLKQDLGQQWSVNFNYNYDQKDRDSRLLYYSGYPTATGADVSLYAGGYDEQNKTHATDLNIQGKIDLFNQQHEVIVGYAYSQSHQKDQVKTATINDTNINNVSSESDGVTYITPYSTDWASWSAQSLTWTAFSPTADYKDKIKSLYAATRIHLNDDLKFILGGNYVQASGDGESYGASMAYDEHKFSPYLGLTYNFTPEYTGYMSYTSIFRPQTTIDEATGKVADPIDGKSYEIGIKSSWLNDQLTGTLAVFRTEENNYPLRSSDGNPTNRKVPISDLRSQGVEVGLAGQLTDDINLSLGYTQFSLKDLKNGGDARTYNPTRSLNLLGTYIFPTLPQLKLGAGLKWIDKTYLLDNTYQTYIRQKSYALLNLMASYDINQNMSVQINGNNLTDKKYLNSFSDGQAYYGKPANYSIALNFKY